MLSTIQVTEIKKLQVVCEAYENIMLKLNWDMLQAANEQSTIFTSYENGELIGFLGLYHFGEKVEVCGMVHPHHRRKGVFSKLISEVFQVIKMRKFKETLLNAPAKSQSAKGFLESIVCSYSFSEYQMKWTEMEIHAEDGIAIRQSTLADLDKEIQLEVKCFGFTEEEARNYYEQMKSGDNGLFFMIESDGKTVGKIRIAHTDGEAWIFGFAILPEYQGKGIGRRVLKKVVIQEHKKGYPIFLEVEAKNHHALKLYEACGFKAFQSQDYYEYKRTTDSLSRINVQ